MVGEAHDAMASRATDRAGGGLAVVISALVGPASIHVEFPTAGDNDRCHFFFFHSFLTSFSFFFLFFFPSCGANDDIKLFRVVHE